MDLAAPLKTEVLRPLVTLIVPGTLAVGPYVFVLGAFVPAQWRFSTAHPQAFAGLIVLSIIAAGFILDDTGSILERSAIDPLVQRRRPNHTMQWKAYLQLQLKDELVAQRHLRSQLTQLKFELGMGQALVVFWGGLGWLQRLFQVWSGCAFAIVTLFLLGSAVLFFLAACMTEGVLSETRELILAAIEAGPKGIPPPPKS